MTILLHPDRYSKTSITRKNGVVIHTSEGSEGVAYGTTLASQQLAGFLQSKGDRPSPSRPGGFYGSGYHAVANESAGYIDLADSTAAPYHAPPCNPTWWSICIPGKAAQTREQWLDPVSYSYIKGVAKYGVDKWKEDGKTWDPLHWFAWPTLKENSLEQANHPAGLTYHSQVSKAWGKTDHTDPGASFPLDVLMQEIGILINPPTPKEDDMALVVNHIVDGNGQPYAFAQFIGYGTPNSMGGWHCREVEWFGPGESDYYKNVSADKNIVHQDIVPQALQGMTLKGNPEQIDDALMAQRGGWKNGNFRKVIRYDS